MLLCSGIMVLSRQPFFCCFAFFASSSLSNLLLPLPLLLLQCVAGSCVAARLLLLLLTHGSGLFSATALTYTVGSGPSYAVAQWRHHCTSAVLPVCRTAAKPLHDSSAAMFADLQPVHYVCMRRHHDHGNSVARMLLCTSAGLQPGHYARSYIMIIVTALQECCSASLHDCTHTIAHGITAAMLQECYCVPLQGCTCMQP